MLFCFIVLSSSGVKAQLTGTKNIPGDYASLDLAITDLNTQGVGPGGVTINLLAGNPQTAPAGGYSITATGTLTDQIIFAGNGNVITASNALTVGALNDAIFKIVGGDYITIGSFDMQENAANTTTAAATNNMTEWGVVLTYATVTNNAQNISLIGNSITLNRTYQNTWGIYANATHALTAITVTASGTGATGGNSGLKIYGNTISNVNQAITVVGPTAAADNNTGIDIGGASAVTGNTITNFGTTSAFSGYVNISGSVVGILVRNSKDYNVSYNNIASSVGGTTTGVLRGIFVPSFSNAPTGTFTNTISNNTISLQNGASNSIEGIAHGSSTSTTTSTLNVNNNNFVNSGHTVAAGATILFITTVAQHFVTNITNNTFTSLNVNTTGTVTFISHNYSLPAAGTMNISGNSIVTSFSKTGAGGSVILTSTNGSSPNGSFTNYLNNNFSNITVTGATAILGFNNTDGAGTSANKVMSGNTFNNWSGAGNGITAINLTYVGATSSIASNTISNFTCPSTIVGINVGSSFNGGNPFTITSNTITGLTSTGAAVTGITCSNTSPVIRINNNTVNALSSAGASLVSGINVTGATSTSVFANKIYGLSTSNAGGTVFAIQVTGGISVPVYNNTIGDLTASIGNGSDVIRGISVSSTVASSVIGVYYNTIYLNATSTGTNFGTTGIFHTVNATATTAALDMRNNIVINESTPNGTGVVTAFRRSGVALNNYAATSNRNLFYAGVPSATQTIMFDGTTPYSTMLAYQTAVVPRDLNSFSGEAFSYNTPGSFFISLTGSSTDFLRPVVGITTQVEGGAANITTPITITTDYAAVTRAGNAGYAGTGTNPDCGAFEFEGISPAPIITLNSVTPPATTQCATVARLVSVNVTTTAGTITGANLFYAINGTPQTPITMTNVSGSTWTATIPASTPVNATITWGVTATNSIGLNSSYNGTTYADEPLFGTTAVATASVATVCSGSPSNLTATISKPGSVQLGTATTTTNTAGITPFNSNWEGSRTQYLIRASELQALGLGAGNITNMGLIVTASGPGTSPQVNYTIKMAHTANTVLTSAYGTPAGAFTTVFTTPSEPAPAIGTRNYTFSTPFNWDGVSNVLVDICHDNDLTNVCASCFSGSSTVQYSVTSFNSVWGSYADNIPSCGVQATNTVSTFNNRPNMIFSGTVAAPITSVTWMDGVTTVGTGNPLTVNPTTTTTYTATITALGCVASPSPTTTVTVNPLPTAPTAANSAQCGTQIPTASVTSTSGLPTPTFIWYDAAVAGSVMQNSTSTTYTSNVAATTTFYVSELNTVTGCESARTPVTVTVAIADGVSASSSAPTICIGSSITLTAANTNPTPNQSYSYSWSSTANSGASTPVAGSPAIITPTQPGTYTYNLTAVDGGCNAVATVNVTVDPFVATLAPINVTCNGYNNGSFSVASSSCGTLPYTYSVGGGAFGAIPTNLAPGTYSVEVKDNNGYQVAAQNVVITQPSTTIGAPTGTNASVCQTSGSAPVSASSSTNTPTPGSVVVNFTVATQPTELSASSVPATVTASPNAIATATMSALPAGAVVTGATLNYNGITALGNSWQSDVRLGLVGAVTQNYTGGTGTLNSAGLFNYASTIPAGSVNVAGGTITMHYFDFFNDNAAGDESTFPTGANVASITINYTVPTPATISWWNAASAGTQIGTGSPFETVGTSVLPNTNTPGVYTVYAQGEFGGCNGLTRTPVTVTVNAPSASTTTITACGSYTWTNGTTYTTSGTRVQTLVNAAGCDSIATLNLTINQPTSSSVTVTACSSYTWAQNGTTYTTSGSYPVVLAGANAVGCDSTVTLNLTINQPTSSTVTATACGSYTWAQNATTYTVSGSYPVVLAGANANGCDSTVTLNLTINQPTSSTVTVSACGSYTWAENTTTYTTSGSYPVVLAGANANGCDSTVTLVLTINQPTSSTVTATACGSYTWAENTTTYTTSGSYSVVLAGANANGCDSTVTLVLTINQPTSSTVTATACGSYTWDENTTTYTTSGSYPVVLAGANANGCDSTVTLILTINQPTSSTVAITECESYTWAQNGTTYTASGSYPVVLAGANANGCDSTVTLVLTITGLPTATATDNGDASMTASAGTSYQWINCATNTAIAGATSQTYTATVNGDYAVVVTNAGGCSDTSSCVNIDYIGLTENTDASIQVFPNPTNSDVTITMTATEATVEVVDAQGKLLQAVTVVNGEKVNLSSYETGVYFLRIRTVNGSTLERVVKQQ